MKFKPMPRFSKGVVFNSGDAVQDELVGRMFIQPRVEAQDGNARRMDDILGGRFALLSWRCDPLASAPPALLAQLEQLGCDRYVGVRARSGRHEIAAVIAGADAPHLLQDNENDLNAWFAKAGVDWVLLRPDRFVAAAGLTAGAQDALSRFCRIAAPNQPGSPATSEILPTRQFDTVTPSAPNWISPVPPQLS
jgi:3-(3-hydroxy-phenyl)propionate hydroxylase